MAVVLIVITFIAGYLAIALEHSIKMNKAASALITGVLCWTIYAFHAPTLEIATAHLMHHLGEIASILFFLLGAMTIVELIDSHGGFEIIIQKIRTSSKRRLLFIVTVLTFLLSAILDNLTTAIVMASLCAKLLTRKEDRLWFCGMIVIASNAGGAWSPLGDVTTTMLWIGGQITPFSILKQLMLPSVAVCIVPAMIIARRLSGQRTAPVIMPRSSPRENIESRIILFTGIGFLVFVPVFKMFTGLPPFMGMLLALGCMWLITGIVHKNKLQAEAEKYSVTKALQKIDSPSILFFLGILLAVTALESFGLLNNVAGFLNANLKNEYRIGAALGLLSSVVDNVPLVAASQGMYKLSTYPTDHHFWELLALSTGTGGSILIIGSAAGVAVMGIEKINFIWYLKRISLLALVGFASGLTVFLLQELLGG